MRITLFILTLLILCFIYALKKRTISIKPYIKTYPEITSFNQFDSLNGESITIDTLQGFIFSNKWSREDYLEIQGYSLYGIGGGGKVASIDTIFYGSQDNWLAWKIYENGDKMAIGKLTIKSLDTNQIKD